MKRLGAGIAVERCNAFTGFLLVLALLLVLLLAPLLPRVALAQAGAPPSVPSGSPSDPTVAGSSAMQPPMVFKRGAQRVDAVEAELVADVVRAKPGEPFRIGLRLAHDPHWHTYWRNPGDSGLPTRFEPSGPAGTTYGDIIWPAPRRLAIGDLANYGYEGELVLARDVTVPSDTDASTVRFEVLAQWLVCKDVCIPGEAALALELPLASSSKAAAASVVALFDASARAAPAAPTMQAGWWQQDGRAWLVLPEGAIPSRAEFFPYFEGVVRPAAPQALMTIGGSASAGGSADAVAASAGAERLALRLEAAAAGSGVPEPAAGVLLMDGMAVEVGLHPVDGEPLAGRLLSTAEVVPSAPPPAAGLLDRLRVGAGTAFTQGLSSSGSGASGTSTAPSAAARPFPSPAIGAASGTLAIAIAGALVGGLILNLMPCVFPVIGLKVLSFSHAAAGSPGAGRRHALAFGAGVVLSFLALGLVMLGLRFAGEAAGWGFQMQSPVFVGAMALLFVLIGLNLFGVFEAGMFLTRLAPMPQAGDGSRAGADAPSGGGYLNSFGTGVVAVLVATPCTAPFMGSAVGYTLSSPPLQTLLVFAALGIGMALPYLVLGWMPRLLRWLPRPGPWLLVFKQLLAFPMLATAAWLAWVLTQQAGADGLLRLLMSAILLAFGAWAYGRAQQAAIGGRSRRGAAAFAAAVVAGVLTIWQLVQIGSSATAPQTANFAAAPAPSTAVPPRPGSFGGAAAAAGVPPAGEASDDAGAQWQAWSPQRVAQSLAQGRPVMVDFTAAWCISCQANKKFVLERDVVRRAFQDREVTLLRADWTRRDPAITAELATFGRNGVPLYLVYRAEGELPLMLPELLTVDIVLAALADGS